MKKKKKKEKRKRKNNIKKYNNLFLKFFTTTVFLFPFLVYWIIFQHLLLMPFKDLKINTQSELKKFPIGYLKNKHFEISKRSQEATKRPGPFSVSDREKF